MTGTEPSLRPNDGIPYTTIEDAIRVDNQHLRAEIRELMTENQRLRNALIYVASTAWAAEAAPTAKDFRRILRAANKGLIDG